MTRPWLPPFEALDRAHLGGRLELDPSAVIGRGVSIDLSADVTIGAGAIIGEQTLILTHEHEHPGCPLLNTSVTATPLAIGAHAFIGARTVVLAAVRQIGAGAIIGAGSILTRDVPALELWAGNPAHLIRRLDRVTDPPR